MAKNAAAGRGRLGPIKDRIQSFNPLTKRWTKTSTITGQFLDVKADDKPFKSVRKAKRPK
jgi:hypothetical protein